MRPWPENTQPLRRGVNFFQSHTSWTWRLSLFLGDNHQFKKLFHVILVFSCRMLYHHIFQLHLVIFLLCNLFISHCAWTVIKVDFPEPLPSKLLRTLILINGALFPPTCTLWLFMYMTLLESLGSMQIQNSWLAFLGYVSNDNHGVRVSFYIFTNFETIWLKCLYISYMYSY